MTWAKHRAPATYDLAASNLMGCDIDDLEGARDMAARTDSPQSPLYRAAVSRTIAMND